MREQSGQAVGGPSPDTVPRPGSGREVARVGPRKAAWIARSLCALSIGLAALGLLLVLGKGTRPDVPVFAQWMEDAVVAVGFSTLGAVVAPRFPSRNPIGWLFCALGLVAGVLLFCGEYAIYSLLANPGALPSGEAMAWIVSWAYSPSTFPKARERGHQCNEANLQTKTKERITQMG